MNASEFLGGQYLKAADVTTPVVVTIRDAVREVVGKGQQQQTKLVVYFHDFQKASRLQMLRPRLSRSHGLRPGHRRLRPHNHRLDRGGTVNPEQGGTPTTW